MKDVKVMLRCFGCTYLAKQCVCSNKAVCHLSQHADNRYHVQFVDLIYDASGEILPGNIRVRNDGSVSIFSQYSLPVFSEAVLLVKCYSVRDGYMIFGSTLPKERRVLLAGRTLCGGCGSHSEGHILFDVDGNPHIGMNTKSIDNHHAGCLGTM